MKLIMLIPNKNCSHCVRLNKSRSKYKILHPSWHNSPVASFGNINSKLLIVGLAPGLKGANRTGRPFTGDHAGITLYTTLLKNNLATGSYKEDSNDNIALQNTRITNSVRCVPPNNKPNNLELANCRKYLKSEINNMENLQIILALGLIAHTEILKIFELKLALNKFTHGKTHTINKNIIMYDSYHCSRYNINTRKLTIEMFNEVIYSISKKI
jgi:uracil-DNA glycosylase